jgi:putative transposase
MIELHTWLAQRPHCKIHYTPTYSSWLKRVERWFALITQRAICLGSFRSVKELVEKIDAFVGHYNRSHRPFVWTANADSIFAKVARPCSDISRTQH